MLLKIILLNKIFKKVSLFGSYLNNQANEDSDIDLLIEFVPQAKVGFFKLIDIQQNIEQQLQKPVDLLTPEALSKYFKQDVIKQSETVYER